MTDLENNSNIYINLSQSAYPGRPRPFSMDSLSNKQLNELQNNNSIKYKFPDAKDAYGNDISTIYLQADNTLEAVKNLFGKTYDKGLLTDEKAGFNAYYLTDTPNLSHTYFAIRGSDGASWRTKNDWIDNNYEFAVNKAYIPQAKLATEAMHQKIAEII